MPDSRQAVATSVESTSATAAGAPAGAAAAIVLRRPDDPAAACLLGPPAAEVISVFEQVRESGRSEALLLWPQRPDGVAVFHALAALSHIGECDEHGLATLFFPWSRATGGTQRTLLVDRDYICKTTLPALDSALRANGHPVLGYLMALHSLKHLLLSGKPDVRFRRALKANPGLMHPTLFEIMPQHGVQNSGLRPYDDQFLRRLRSHTWIGNQQQLMQYQRNFVTANNMV